MDQKGNEKTGTNRKFSDGRSITDHHIYQEEERLLWDLCWNFRRNTEISNGKDGTSGTIILWIICDFSHCRNMDWITLYRSFSVYFHRLTQITCSSISIRRVIDQGKSKRKETLISPNHFRVRIYGLYNNSGTHEYTQWLMRCISITLYQL